MPSKKVKVQRARFDGAYIFASVFVAFGGLALLGSYADRKPLATFAPGTYNLARFATGHNGEYNLGIRRGLSYCFSPYQVSNGASISIVPSSGSQHTLSLVQTSADEACFRSDTSYDHATVQLPSVIPSPIALNVRQ